MKVFAEVAVVHEKSPIVGVPIEANPLFFRWGDVVPACIVVAPGDVGLFRAPRIPEFD
jgi:hypothetical protein